jgi:succinate dehydrogenase / fumarate reductase iron-sulfur subunit
MAHGAVDVEQVQEFRKCIEVLPVPGRLSRAPRASAVRPVRRSAPPGVRRPRNAPLDTERRAGDLKNAHGVGYCNITKCCTKVCPEGITITDNAIIPLKERVIDQLYDPVAKLFRLMRRSS